MNINSDEELINAILNELKIVISKVIKDFTNDLKENIENKIYANDSSFYDKTYQILNSVINPIVEIRGNSIIAKLGINSSIIKSEIVKDNNKFNRHASVDNSSIWNGIPINEAVLAWWDKGANGIVPTPNTEYWKSVFGDYGFSNNPKYSIFEESLNNEISKTLSKFGIVQKNINLNIS